MDMQLGWFTKANITLRGKIVYFKIIDKVLKDN